MILSKKKLFLLLIFLGIISFILITDYLYFRNRLYPGVHLKTADLGGKTFNEVEAALADIQFLVTGPEGKVTSLPLRDIGIILDSKQIFDAGYRQGRLHNRPWSYVERLNIKLNGAAIPFWYHLDVERQSQGIRSFREAFNTEPQNAFFKVDEDGSRAELVPEKAGYHLDIQAFTNRLMENIAQRDTPLLITAPYETIPPEITVSSLKEKGIETLMSSFTTNFDPDVTNRVHNIKLAAEILNNYFLAPGETLSLNQLFGDTTAEKGYKEAPIIVEGELVPGFGGGLCQISSTLYNAALLANMEIIERHNHNLTVPYLPPGRDATLAYPSRDLKIRNNKDHYVLVTALVENDELTFRLFGRSPEEKVEIDTKILDTVPPPLQTKLDPDLAPGEEEIIEGSPGYRVEVWKKVYRGETLQKEEKIATDSYLPYPKIIKRGPVQND